MKKLLLLLCIVFSFAAENVAAQSFSLRLNDTTLSDTFSVRRGFRMPKSPARKNITKRTENEKNQTNQANQTQQAKQQTNQRGGFLSGLFLGALLGGLMGWMGNNLVLVFLLLFLGGLALYFKSQSNKQD